jgi:hypothetical protein
MAFSVDSRPKSTYTDISDVFAQNTCLLKQQLVDGETYDVYIKAWDIMNNTKVRNYFRILILGSV